MQSDYAIVCNSSHVLTLAVVVMAQFLNLIHASGEPSFCRKTNWLILLRNRYNEWGKGLFNNSSYVHGQQKKNIHISKSICRGEKLEFFVLT